MKNSLQIDNMPYVIHPLDAETEIMRENYIISV